MPKLTVTTSEEYDDHFEQLANTLRGFLTIYEGLCILKQVRPQILTLHLHSPFAESEFLITESTDTLSFYRMQKFVPDYERSLFVE